jgi:hypothetical protein
VGLVCSRGFLGIIDAVLGSKLDDYGAAYPGFLIP